MMCKKVIFLFLALASPAWATTVLVEAESFDNLGGWVIDQQFMDQMGSPYLLAHGLGVPVEDAETEVEFSKSGEYAVFVRTFDWVGPWKGSNVPKAQRATGFPGRFEILINDDVLNNKVFGTEGFSWGWQYGGKIDIQKGTVKVSLHDLTGFEGRCDAIVFSDEEGFEPPKELKAMGKWRQELLGYSDEPEDAGEYDIVVVGGGLAGVCTSLSAGRLGMEAALIQDRPVLGGNNSSEVRVWLNGKINVEPYPRIGDVVKELEPKERAHYGPENTADKYEDDKREARVRAERNIKLYLMHRVNDVEVEDGKIKAVIAQDIRSGQRKRFDAKFFVDCTGDGCVGFLAGADYDMTIRGHLGRSNLWNVVEKSEPVDFPRCPWAVDLSDKVFPGLRDNPGTYGKKELEALGGWYWESGFFYDPIEKSEYIRDLNLRAMYGAWDALKNVHKQYPNHKLEWAAYISGKRESRRLLGDIVLTTSDLLKGKEYEDGCVPTSWTIDTHLPLARYVHDFGYDAFISKDHHAQYPRPYWVPYRCLYSRNIENLFMAGRDISVTHEALGTVRVMRTTGMMGEVVGMAASLCKKHGVNPRDIYEEYLGELKQLMTKGVGKSLKAENN
jgi:hypothetical protein